MLAALDDPYEPVLALTAIWPEGRWPDLDGAFVNGDPVVAWLADDGRRRGDGAPVLVAHSTAEFAAEHLGEPAAAEGPMVAALRDVLDLPAPAYASVHRWSFARPTGQRDAPYFLGGSPSLGVCGDGWHGKSRVEGAYLSGRALGRALAERLA